MVSLSWPALEVILANIVDIGDPNTAIDLPLSGTHPKIELGGGVPILHQIFGTL